jgi:hypothetical protein
LCARKILFTDIFLFVFLQIRYKQASNQTRKQATSQVKMMTSNDLSSITRAELLRAVVAQQSQLRSQQQQQQQHTTWAGLTQTQHPSNSFATVSHLQDHVLDAQGTRRFGGASVLAERKRFAYDPLLSMPNTARSNLFGNVLMADVARRRDSVSTRDLIQARALLELESSNAMLRQQLFGTAGNSTFMTNAFASDLPNRSCANHSLLPTDLPSEGSTEDIMLRRLMISGKVESQAADAATLSQTATHFDPPHRSMESMTHHLLTLPFPVSHCGQHTNAGSAGAAPQASLPKKDTKPPAPAVAVTDGKVPAKKKTKRPLSAYNIFFKEEHAMIIDQNEREMAEKRARGEDVICSDDDYCDEDDDNAAVDITKTKGNKRKRSLSTNQPGKRGKRQVDFENLTKVIGKRWKKLPSERVEGYKRRAETAMQAYRMSLFQKIRNSVKEDQS